MSLGAPAWGTRHSCGAHLAFGEAASVANHVTASRSAVTWFVRPPTTRTPPVDSVAGGGADGAAASDEPPPFSLGPCTGRPFTNPDWATDVRRQPIWLLGRAGRELYGSPDGADANLARRSGACTAPAWRGDAVFPERVLKDEARKLSRRYRRQLFYIDEPRAPKRRVDLVLAVLVVVPEVLGLVILVLTTAFWEPRQRHALAMVIGIGLISLVGIGVLAHEERVGASRRTATLRRVLSTARTATEWSTRPSRAANSD